MREHFVWDVSRVALDLGFIQLRWYGLFFAAAFVIGLLLARRVFERLKLPREDMDRMTMFVFFGTLIGARLGHILFYAPAHYFSNPVDIIKIWEGGLASHGGAIGIILAMYLYSKRHKTINLLRAMDIVCVPLGLATASIRMGNFFNSEIIGDPSTLPWAIIFTSFDAAPHHPTMLYEALAYTLIFLIIWTLFTRTNAIEKPGVIFGLSLILLFSARFMIEFTKLPQASFDVPFGLSMGQLLSIPALIAGVIIFKRSTTKSVAI